MKMRLGKVMLPIFTGESSFFIEGCVGIGVENSHERECVNGLCKPGFSRLSKLKLVVAVYFRK